MSSGLFATPTPTPIGIPQADGSGFIDPDWLRRGNFSSPPIFQQTDGTGAVFGTGVALTLSTQVQKSVWAGPVSGADAAPTFRLLVAGDIPDLSGVYQPLNAKLTAISALANSPGWLYNNGSGVFAYTAPSDSDILFTDITTNNSSTLKHGFLPKLSGSSTQYLNGQGNYVTISGSSTPSGYIQQAFTSQTSITVTHNFGVYPLVQILDASGSPAVEVPLTITHTSVNAFNVTFSSAQSGTIIASVGSPALPKVVTTATNYSVLISDNIIIATAINITLTLPDGTGKTGKEFTLDNNSSGNIFVTGTAGQTIENLPTQTVPTQSAMLVYFTGSNWRIK